MTGHSAPVPTGMPSPASLLLLLLCLLGSPTHAQQVVVNPEVDEQSLTLNGVRAIFFMRLAQWPSDGQPIKVFVLPDNDPLHIQFSKNKLNVFPRQLRRSWDRLVFSGTGQSPTVVSDEQEMRQRVANTPGAIGYLQEAEQDDSVRTLAVE